MIVGGEADLEAGARHLDGLRDRPKKPYAISICRRSVFDYFRATFPPGLIPVFSAIRVS